MRALVLKQFDTQPILEIEERQDVTPKTGEAVVRIHRAALNPLDLAIMTGAFPHVKQPPLILGTEASGVVVTSSVYAPGTRVIVSAPTLGILEDGVIQNYVSVPESYVLPLPESYNFDEGAAYSVAYVTAYVALTQYAQVKPGDYVAITGASGSVGYATIQVAQALCANPIAIVSTSLKAEQVQSARPYGVIDLSQENVQDGIARITNGFGTDLIIDPVGGELVEQLIAAAAPNARFVSIGDAAGLTTTINLMDIIVKQIQIVGLNILTLPQNTIVDAYQSLLPMAEAGQLRPLIDSRFPIEDAEHAIARLLSRKAVGKIIFQLK
ncbi:hypothetical protein C2W64_03637 [Brevibacillus laterosporus]|nr:zinc-binding dehydrogenase [Brevibacillus laterosporus]RAP21109.1 hypothetical protein C2W64_03637 [Brevibacillus laterosporus]